MEEEMLIEDSSSNEAPNEIIELEQNEEITNTQYDMPGVGKNLKEEQKKKPKKKVSKWSKLPKKTKIIIIVSASVVFLLIVGILLYFLVFKKDKSKPKKDEPIVIVEKENYIYKDGNLVFIDKDKNELGTYECKNKNEFSCYVANYSNEDEFDVAKKVYEDGTSVNIRSDIFFDNYVFVYDNEEKTGGKVSLYDIKDKKVKDEYDLVKELDEENAIVSKDKKYGVLGFSKNDIDEAIKFDYDYLGFIEESKYLVASDNGNYMLISKTGDNVSKKVPGMIKNFNSKNLSVKVDNSYFVYDFEGKKVSEESFDYISFAGDYVITIVSKKLNVIDNLGNRMNGDAIKLSSSSYETKIIFNESLRQTGKEETYNAYVNGNTLKIELKDETITINLSDGIFSKDLSYISYFAGKLYFYSDEAKTKLLGSYACNYANSITDSTTVLENCYLATESNLFNPQDDTIINSYIPIYNDRYVFIADTKTPKANDNIIMYDLKTSKSLATYKEIDLGYHQESEMLNFVDTAGNIALAYSIKNNSYGLINIGNSNVSTLIPFTDDNQSNIAVSMLDNNLLFKRSDNTYHLYDTKGNKLTGNLSVAYEIIKYQKDYVMVKTGNNTYMIYQVSTGKMLSSECNFIAMEAGFYITVDTKNKVGVYKYDSSENLLDDEITIDEGSIDSIKYNVSGINLTMNYVTGGSTASVVVNIG